MMNEQQHLRLLHLIDDLRDIAEPVGSLHAWWDVISDMQAFTRGQRTIVTKTADEWIAYAEKLLSEKTGR